MGIDWEEILGAEGADIADAYDSAIAHADELDEYAKDMHGDDFGAPAN